MGNKSNIPTKYQHNYWLLDNLELEEIKNYKIIKVDKLDKFEINQIILNDDYFNQYPAKSRVINNILNYCLTHEEKEKIVKTDYICNKRIKVCICNKEAENFQNALNQTKYITWCKKS